MIWWGAITVVLATLGKMHLDGLLAFIKPLYANWLVDKIKNGIAKLKEKFFPERRVAIPKKNITDGDAPQPTQNPNITNVQYNMQFNIDGELNLGHVAALTKLITQLQQGNLPAGQISSDAQTPVIEEIGSSSVAPCEVASDDPSNLSSYFGSQKRDSASIAQPSPAKFKSRIPRPTNQLPTHKKEESNSSGFIKKATGSRLTKGQEKTLPK